MNPVTFIAIGDLFLPAALFREIAAPRLPASIRLTALDWDTGDLETLQKHNLAAEQHGAEAIPAPQNLLDAVGDAEMLFTQFCPVNQAVLDAAPRLQLICVGRTGIQNVALDEATRRGIAVLNTVGRNAHAVAEYTIGIILAEMRNIARAHAALKTGVWRKEFANSHCVPELPGRTIGLVGFGAIGRLMVRKLAGFEVRALVCDPYVPAEALAECGAEKADLDRLMCEADFVSIHAKLTDETRGLIDAGKLALMKPTAYLINTARAELVDEEALIAVLKAGRIAGAALDVFMHEPPPPSDPLLALDNVTLSPHQAGVTTDAYSTTVRLLIENLSALWNDTDALPRNLLNEAAKSALASLKQRLSKS